MREEQVATLGETPIRQPGMVGASMGTTSLSTDNRWWCVYVKAEDKFRLHVIDVQTGEDTVILEAAQLLILSSIPMTRPSYAMPVPMKSVSGLSAAMARIGSSIIVMLLARNGLSTRLGSQARNSHDQLAPRSHGHQHRQWRRSLDCPHECLASDGQPCGHPVGGRHNQPGCRLDSLLILAKKCGPIESLCASNASNVGDHWRNDHCPYDDGPVEAYAPQHTHPHPNFSPDGRRVIFTSDQQGFAQVYEVEVPVK